MTLVLFLGVLLVLGYLSMSCFRFGLNGILVKIVQAINTSTNNKSVEIDFRLEIIMVFLSLVFLAFAMVIIVIP